MKVKKAKPPCSNTVHVHPSPLSQLGPIFPIFAGCYKSISAKLSHLYMDIWYLHAPECTFHSAAGLSVATPKFYPIISKLLPSAFSRHAMSYRSVWSSFGDTNRVTHHFCPRHCTARPFNIETLLDVLPTTLLLLEICLQCFCQFLAKNWVDAMLWSKCVGFNGPPNKPGFNGPPNKPWYVNVRFRWKPDMISCQIGDLKSHDPAGCSTIAQQSLRNFNTTFKATAQLIRLTTAQRNEPNSPMGQSDVSHVESLWERWKLSKEVPTW